MLEFPVYLAHDHMQRRDDYQQDLQGGVTGKILHLTVDSWIDAPTKEGYDRVYNSYEGFHERAEIALGNLHLIAADVNNRVRVIREFSDLINARSEGQLAIIAGNEGGKILGHDLSSIDNWFNHGLRHVQLNWAMPNLIGAAQSQENDSAQPGLSEFGVEVIYEMNRRGMIVDVSHSAPQTIIDVLDATSKPILNSHSGGRVVADASQNLWDDQIRAMAANGGVIGIHFCSWMVKNERDIQAEIDDLIRQIRYVSNVGGIDLVALGPDWVLGDPERDGRYLHNTGQPDISWTKGLENSGELPNLWDPLSDAGFTQTDIEKIAGGNLLRLFRDILP